MSKKLLLLCIIISIQLSAQNFNDSIVLSLKATVYLKEHDQLTERIEFNKDTILIAGYLADPSLNSRHENPKNVLYKTIDRGITWEKIKFDGDAWIYTSHHTKDGSIWMGGSDHYIHYSNDFGETWKKRKKPFNPSDRIFSIYMVNSKFGIAGGLSNGLAITHDNWITTEQIESPLDQNKYQDIYNSSINKIDKIVMLDSIIVIEQSGNTYYSNYPTIKWKEFNIPVVDFTIDKIKNKIKLRSQYNNYFFISKTLKLFKINNEENANYKRTNNVFVIDTFFKNEIKSIEITSTKWDQGKSDIQQADYNKTDTIYRFRSKDVKGGQHLKFDEPQLKKVFHGNRLLNIDLDELGKHLNFDSLDYGDYTLFYEKQISHKKERKNWNGDFTSQTNLNNNLFKNYTKITDSTSSDLLHSVFKNNSLDFLFKIKEVNKIELKIVSSNNKILVVSNENSATYSLPWILTYEGEKTETYNPYITEFMKSILPTEFNNYEMLLGGELIFKLIEKNIIKELEHKNGN